MGWRFKRAAQVADPASRITFQSLDAYTTARDAEVDAAIEDANVDLAATVAFLEVLPEWLEWYTNYGASPNAIYEDGGDPALRFSFFGVDGDGDPYVDANSVTAADRAWMGFDTDGTPYLVRVGGPTTPSAPSLPPLP